MANTTSARKAARQAVRRTEVNKSQTSRMRLSVRKVEEAVSSGDKAAAKAALCRCRADSDARLPERGRPQKIGGAQSFAPRFARQIDVLRGVAITFFPVRAHGPHVAKKPQSQPRQSRYWRGSNC